MVIGLVTVAGASGSRFGPSLFPRLPTSCARRVLALPRRPTPAYYRAAGLGQHRRLTFNAAPIWAEPTHEPSAFGGREAFGPPDRAFVQEKSRCG